jgi:hypothetical protein
VEVAARRDGEGHASDFGVLLVASLTTLSGVWSAMTAMVATDFGWKRAATPDPTSADGRLCRGLAS